MLAFATLFAIAGLLVPSLVQAAVPVLFTNTGNSVVLKVWQEDDHPTIVINGEVFLDKPGGQGKNMEVAFRPSRNGKKDEWERQDDKMYGAIPAGKRAEFTLKLGKGLGERTCHLKRSYDTFDTKEFVFQSDANYLSHCRDVENDKVWVVCGETIPGSGGNELATCDHDAFPQPSPEPVKPNPRLP